ncbi:MAG: lysine--tRNA ligase, partial [Coriobacteriales bacterium]|nr:lysine--tRNA ligase [Coriobacteriales bacterium]
MTGPGQDPATAQGRELEPSAADAAAGLAPGAAGAAAGAAGAAGVAAGAAGVAAGAAAASDDPIAVRKAKRAALLEQGRQPYARRFEPSDDAAGLAKRYSDLADGETTDERASIAGRVMAIRDQGKVLFIVVRDATADLQLFCKADVLGPERFAEAKDLDLGDWIGVSGFIMRTRRGQLSIAPEQIDLLAKALRPLPEKFHGLSDKETRYRQRYVDLIVNPEVRDVFTKRFKIVAALRRGAEERGFVEVETPMLHPIPGGAMAKPFVTHHNALGKDLYLRIAPELHLKRLLVGGFERVFEINRSFRNEGMDPHHNPEFTTFEAYQAFTDMQGMMELTRDLIQEACLAANGSLQIDYQGERIDLSGGWESRTMIDLVSEAAGEEVSFNRTLTELKTLANHYQISLQDDWKEGRLIAELYEKLVEGRLAQPTFVTEHPLETSPLARRKLGSDEVTDRFELVICGHEFANAFSELNDPVDQRERFAAQMAAKAAGDEE